MSNFHLVHHSIIGLVKVRLLDVSGNRRAVNWMPTVVCKNHLNTVGICKPEFQKPETFKNQTFLSGLRMFLHSKTGQISNFWISFEYHPTIYKRPLFWPFENHKCKVFGSPLPCTKLFRFKIKFKIGTSWQAKIYWKFNYWTCSAYRFPPFKPLALFIQMHVPLLWNGLFQSIASIEMSKFIRNNFSDFLNGWDKHDLP